MRADRERLEHLGRGCGAVRQREAPDPAGCRPVHTEERVSARRELATPARVHHCKLCLSSPLARGRGRAMKVGRQLSWKCTADDAPALSPLPGARCLHGGEHGGTSGGLRHRACPLPHQWEQHGGGGAGALGLSCTAKSRPHSLARLREGSWRAYLFGPSPGTTSRYAGGLGPRGGRYGWRVEPVRFDPARTHVGAM